MQALLCFQVFFQPLVEKHQHQQRAERAGARPHTGPACRCSQPLGQEIGSKKQHGDNPYQLFRNFGTGGRRHNLPSLQIPAEAGQKSYEKYRRRQGNDRVIGPGVPDKLPVDQFLRAEEQRQRKDQSGYKQQAQGNVENPFRAFEIIFGYLFRRHDGNRHRYARRGNRDCHQVNRKAHLVQTDAFPAQHTAQQYPVQRADDLHHDTGYGEDQRAFQKTVIAFHQLLLKNANKDT